MIGKGAVEERPSAGQVLRAGGIDVGSNAMRLIVGEFQPSGVWLPLAQHRVPVRLGSSVFAEEGGALSDEAMERALEVLRGFRNRMDELGVTVYRAAATSAVREAANRALFLERAIGEAGIALATISPGEEARLVWLAVGSRIRLRDRTWAMVDLGGGSVEIAVAEGDAIVASESHTMGTVRLLAELGGGDVSPARFRRLAGEYIDTMTSRLQLDTAKIAGLVATGGNIEELARLAGAPCDEAGVARLPLADLSATIGRLSGLSPQQRIERFGFRPDRADVILPAALVYERVATAIGVDALIVPNVGLKEGLLMDAAGHASRHAETVSRQERDLLTAAVALGRRYLFDERHARHVAQLALSLFDQLVALHGMGVHERRMLLAAALLHDIGQFVSYRRHHKHSWYLISHAGLPEFSPDETAIVALIARYHRRAEPRLDHEGYADLAPADRERVDGLAALLRIADSLDRQHRQHVRRLGATVFDDRIELDVDVSGDASLEEWAIERKAQWITRVFDVGLRVRFPESG